MAGLRAMTVRRIVRTGAMWIAGLLSFSLMGIGLISAMGIDNRFNPVASTLYYILPMASFPIFVFGFVWRKTAIGQAILAVVYLVVCARLDWRACSSHGYCAGAVAVILLALKTRPVLAFLGTAAASLAAMALDERS